MITTISKALTVSTICLVLAACGGAPASNELQLDDDGNGRFSGSAGAEWSAEDIRSFVAGTHCGPGRSLANFSVRVLPSAPDFKIYSGQCV